MKFPCSISAQNSVKKGMKITLSVDEKNVQDVMKGLYNFLDRPLTAELLIDADEQLKKLGEISPDQRRKVYAILKDIAAWNGDSAESIKLEMKKQFCFDGQFEDFSLSNCSRELAAEFITWLIGFCFEHGVELKHTGHPIEAFDDIEAYLKLCIEKKVCCICGSKNADIHHYDHIGLGGTSKPELDSLKRKIALCRTHHTEAHALGKESFCNKYKVTGVLV